MFERDFITKFAKKIMPYVFIRFSQVAWELINYPLKEDVKICQSVEDASFLLIVDNLFDPDRATFYEGGGEKYALTLAKTLNKIGKVAIVQRAKKRFVRNHEDIVIIGLPIPRDILGDLQLNIRTYKLFKNNQHIKLFIYSPFSLCYPFKLNPSIGISHGIFWDFAWHTKRNLIDKMIRKLLFRQVTQSLFKLEKVIVNDTNIVNWVRAINPYSNVWLKLVFLPNFVDTSTFRRNKKHMKKEKNKMVIVYPRRLSKERGVYVALEVAQLLCKKYSHIEFHFVGIGNEADKIKNLIIKENLQNRILVYKAAYDEMPEVYNYADIAIFPSLGAEGTSLACLEAMAMGCAIVASNVGGLTDLIIHGYNGLLVRPTVKDFMEAIELLIVERGKLEFLANNARNVSRVFEIKEWENHFIKIVNSIVS